jgi:hypothetical protein
MQVHWLLLTLSPPQRIPQPPQFSSSFLRSTSQGNLDEGHVADGSVHVVTGHMATSGRDASAASLAPASGVPNEGPLDGGSLPALMVLLVQAESTTRESMAAAIAAWTRVRDVIVHTRRKDVEDAMSQATLVRARA